MELQKMDCYLKGKNEDFNEFNFMILKDAIKSDLFKDYSKPLFIVQGAANFICDNIEKPFLTYKTILEECDMKDFTKEQIIFMLNWVLSYLDSFEFENDVSILEALIKSQIKELKGLSKYAKLEKGKAIIREVIFEEITKLPDEIKDLYPSFVALLSIVFSAILTNLSKFSLFSSPSPLTLTLSLIRLARVLSTCHEISDCPLQINF